MTVNGKVSPRPSVWIATVDSSQRPGVGRSAQNCRRLTLGRSVVAVTGELSQAPPTPTNRIVRAGEPTAKGVRAAYRVRDSLCSLARRCAARTPDHPNAITEVPRADWQGEVLRLRQGFRVRFR